jgi:tRNA G10  N-methylase Trm11
MIHNSCYYVFVLGREQKIALAELKSVLRRFCFDFGEINPDRSVGADFEELNLSLVGNCTIINIKNRDDNEVAGLIENLGGTLKIYKIVAPGDNKLSNQIASLIVDKFRGSKINFGISNYAGERLGQGLGASIKENLKYRKVNSRYVKPREGEILSSAESWHNIVKKGGVEIGIFTHTDFTHRMDTERENQESRIKNHEKLTANSYNLKALGVLLAVSNPDEWAKKDFGKPRSDAKSGMMPPKLARMLINIAIEQYQKSNIKNQNENCELKIENFNDIVVVDPFCGSGNILIEALDMGFFVAGGDISERAVENTKVNLSWLKAESRIKNQESRIHNSSIIIHDSIEVLDATKADFSKLIEALEAPEACEAVIVTEPYLGVPRKEKMSEEEAKREIEKLKPLYLGFLENIYRQKDIINLKSICIVFPLFELSNGKNISLLEESIDEIRKIGYIVPCSPLIYGREYQIIKRQIIILQLKNEETKELKN